MNGLEDIYSTEIEVRRLNANESDGISAFKYYRLQGHPAYLLLNSDGEVLWQGLGVQPGKILQENIDIALGK